MMPSLSGPDPWESTCTAWQLSASEEADKQNEVACVSESQLRPTTVGPLYSV